MTLKPWREIAVPHEDVHRGTFQQAEFAADITQVHEGRAGAEYQDPELFFPVGNTGAAYQQIEEAKAVCRTCKVIDACLKCALDTNQDYGVWGGLSEDERRALKRRAMRARRSQAMQMQI